MKPELAIVVNQIRKLSRYVNGGRDLQYIHMESRPVMGRDDACVVLDSHSGSVDYHAWDVSPHNGDHYNDHHALLPPDEALKVLTEETLPRMKSKAKERARQEMAEEAKRCQDLAEEAHVAKALNRL